MDGRGRAFDNIFVERLWRSVKYENVYINGYLNIPEARCGLGKYFELYNTKRFHQSLDYKTPVEVYKGGYILKPSQMVQKAANGSGFQTAISSGN